MNNQKYLGKNWFGLNLIFIFTCLCSHPRFINLVYCLVFSSHKNDDPLHGVRWLEIQPLHEFEHLDVISIL